MAQEKSDTSVIDDGFEGRCVAVGFTVRRVVAFLVFTMKPLLVPKLQYNRNRERADQRVRPRLWNSRWYVLRQLAVRIEGVVAGFVRQREKTDVIDLGCGGLPYRSLFESAGATYHGVDLPGNDKADSFFTELGLTNADDGSFDMALSIQVLEHVYDPKSYLNEAHRVLRPGGHIVLSTHGIWIHHPDPGDYWRWTCEGLQRQMVASGFRIVHFTGCVGLSASGLQLIQDGVLRTITESQHPIFGRVLRAGRLPLTVLFQLAMALADFLSSDRKRQSDALLFFVIARAEPLRGCKGTDDG